MLEPWETEEFRACLEGTAFAFTVVQGAHAYRIETAGEEARLTPMGKLATEPDPEGLEVASFHSTGGSLEMVLRDRWASRYSGDRTVLRAELRRGSLGFDPVLWKGELALEPGAELHTVRFDWLASTLGRRLEPGAEYDVAWGFKRLGAVSLGTFVDRGRTPKVAYLAPLAGGNR